MNFTKFLRTPIFIEHLQWLLLDIRKPIHPVNSNEIVPTIKNYNYRQPARHAKPVRPVDVRFVNSNKLLRFINFSKPVCPIDDYKSVRPVNFDRPVYPVMSVILYDLLMFVNLLVLLIFVSLSLSTTVAI